MGNSLKKNPTHTVSLCKLPVSCITKITGRTSKAVSYVSLLYILTEFQILRK